MATPWATAAVMSDEDGERRNGFRFGRKGRFQTMWRSSSVVKSSCVVPAHSERRPPTGRPVAAAVSRRRVGLQPAAAE